MPAQLFSWERCSSGEIGFQPRQAEEFHIQLTLTQHLQSQALAVWSQAEALRHTITGQGNRTQTAMEPVQQNNLAILTTLTDQCQIAAGPTQ